MSCLRKTVFISKLNFEDILNFKRNFTPSNSCYVNKELFVESTRIVKKGGGSGLSQ